MESKTFSCIVAACANNGIGKDGQLPWKLPGDMKYFKSVTTKTFSKSVITKTQEETQSDSKSTVHTESAAAVPKMNAVIMGRKTWESIPAKFRPLSDRINIVLSSTLTVEDAGVKAFTSLDEALTWCNGADEVEEIFAIGGSKVYEEAFTKCDKIFLTRVGKQFECDTFIPAVDESVFAPVYVSKTHSDNEIPYDFITFEKKNSRNTDKETGKFFYPLKTEHEEFQYLDLIRDIIENGDAQDDRTGVGTVSKFGCQMRFDLKKSFPLLTTKRVFWRGVIEELLWFLKGDTNANNLAEKNVKIWDGNGSREFLDKCGLNHREVGDLGPVYGFQWRHFGAEYKDMHADYTGEGYDQVKRVIETLKTNPADRRMIISAWNPAALKDMALPPCHMFCQFYVNSKRELSCLLYQRSCDMGLGVPFNIASYAALTYMIAQVTGFTPGEFIHSMGNTHVYKNHIEPLKNEQLDRIPKPFPILKLNPEKTDIDSFVVEDFELVGYAPHKTVKMEMAV